MLSDSPANGQPGGAPTVLRDSPLLLAPDLIRAVGGDLEVAAVVSTALRFDGLVTVADIVRLTYMSTERTRAALSRARDLRHVVTVSELAGAQWRVEVAA